MNSADFNAKTDLQKIMEKVKQNTEVLGINCIDVGSDGLERGASDVRESEENN